jgi:alkanesulfonate monooxygenase SsuD/methylene tetrahydromethanopterin reductase-like flavin-dependent oxidoreductase (luciferase family)
MIRPWVFEFFPAPREAGATDDPALSAAHFDFYLDLWPTAEPLGFEGIFFSEHHFGPAYSPAPNLLIAAVARRTRTLRLGVMGLVLAYHTPWRIAEEIGMLDHLTGGRLEIGTSAGIPQEIAHVGLSVAEARARYDEATEILDKALSQGVVSHSGRFWTIENLRLVPRPLQRPMPPRWVTVISEDSARKAARRGAKICTGFHPLDRVISIFDAYRDEAARLGLPAGPDQLALRRQVTLAREDAAAKAAAVQRETQYRSFIMADPRLATPERQVFDTPVSHAFSIGPDEFVTGTPDHVAADIIEQCHRCGAGHFLAVFDRSAAPSALAAAWELFGTDVIPALRAA